MKMILKAIDRDGNKLTINETTTDDTYWPPVKHSIEYKNAFDLVDICLSEYLGDEPHDYNFER